MNFRYSEDEERFISIGTSKSDRILIVAHTDRNNRIRVISARELNRTERKEYENEIQKRKG